MPTFLPASFARWLFCCVTLAAAVAFPTQALGQKYVEIAAPAAATDSSSSKKITVRMWVIEAETEKLRNLGFEWNQITSGSNSVSKPASILTTPISTAGDIASAISKADSNEFKGFLKALEQNNLARTLAEPTVVTLSGRKATLQVGQQGGQHTKLDVTPTALDDRRIELCYQIEVASQTDASTMTHFKNSATVQIEAGKPFLISQPRSSSPAASGKPRRGEILLLVQADRLP